MLPHTFQFNVPHQEVDAACRQTITSLGACLLNAAGWSANQLGFGRVSMLAQNRAWVLSRMHVELRDVVRMDEQLTVETWPRNCGRLTSLRCFCLRNAAGELLGEATSLWSVIDFTTRRPVNLQTAVDFEGKTLELDVAAAEPTRVEELHSEPVAQHTVCYSDIDFNQHANSMKYLQWMLDTLDFDFLTSHQIAEFDINYVHEARCGELVHICREWHENGLIFELKNAELRTYCRARFVFDEKK